MASGSAGGRLLKKARSTVLYVLYLLVFMLAIDYVVFYRPAIRELREKASKSGGRDLSAAAIAPLRHADADVIRLVAHADNHKTSHFSKFSKAKGEGVVRICTHGDSYTEGEETDPHHDYPGLLQKLFEQRGAGNVEVVNFGIAGYGFHQSYLLWDRVAKGFDCDVHLFGPRGFWPLRDTTYGALASWSPYYLHARYILDGGDVRLVELLGETYHERFEHHFAFLPSWRYWRYTRRPPMFLQAMIPAGRELENPFYYDRRDMLEEAREMQRILLARMLAEDKAPILIGHHRPDVGELADALAHERLGAVQFPELITPPYLAPFSHAGPLGNQLLARLFFDQLTGQLEEPVPVLELADLDWQEHGAGPGQRRKIETYSRVDFEIGGVAVAELYIVGWAAKPLKVDGLVALHGGGETLLESAFFPTDFELQPGMELTLRLEQGSQTEDYPLGEITVLGGGLNVGAVRVPGFEFWSYKDFEHLQDRGEPSPLTHGQRRFRGLFFTGNDDIPLEDLLGRGRQVTVLLGGKPVLQGKNGKLVETEGLWLYPEGDHLRLPRAKVSGLVDLAALPEEGDVELVVEHWQDGVVRVPIARWHKRRLDPPQPRRPLRKIVAVGDDGRAVVRDAPAFLP